MSSFTVKPAQVFAAINNANDQTAASHTAKSKHILSNDPNKISVVSSEEIAVRPKDIQVTATGEVVFAPDVCRLVITISSQKEAAQDVKNSVTRRLDYVLQTLRNHQIRVSYCSFVHPEHLCSTCQRYLHRGAPNLTPEKENSFQIIVTVICRVHS